MMARREKMNRLFALQAAAGITNAERRGWATRKLNRQHNPVTTYRDLTEDEIDRLAAAAEQIVNGSPGDGYVMCGELGPDDLPCVDDVSHLDLGRPCVDEFGREWVLR